MFEAAIPRILLFQVLSLLLQPANCFNKWTTFSTKSAVRNINEITISLIQSNNSIQRVLATAGAAQ